MHRPLFSALLLGLLAMPVGALSPRLYAVNDWLYVLQPGAVGLPAIQASSYDALVIDYSLDGGASSELTTAQVGALKASGKVVLAYLSIGEAEDYRYYWQSIWNDQPAPDPDAPAWLGPFNPEFPNNYKVRYWQAPWQAILFGTTSGPNKSYLDRIIDQGFDGIYLDIVDAFTYWDEDGERPRAQSRLDMMDLIAALANYARVTRNRPGFLVFPQNGIDVVRDGDDVLDAAGSSFLSIISGVGVEDLYWNETVPQDPQDTNYRLSILDQFQAAGAAVVLVDYVWDENAPGSAANIDRTNDLFEHAQFRGYIPYAAVTDRGLDEIVTFTATGGLTAAQPKANTFLVFRNGFESGTTGGWSLAMP
jgi:cysteinyl-tRNA synthetase